MSDASGWASHQYFESTEPQMSLDGGTTSAGPLWHAVSSRWGHSMHALCSYQGMFPPKLAHYFIQKYSDPGQTILDPFSGRGTTTLQARVEGRVAIGNDLSPLAFVLSKAKATPPSWSDLEAYVCQLEVEYSQCVFKTNTVSPDISMLFDPDTLNQLLFLRQRLQERRPTQWNRLDVMLAAGVAGILHGATRGDGSSSYLSISMPNTFSMSPNYVRRYIHEKGLVPPKQNVFSRLLDKLAIQYLDATDGPDGKTFHSDAVALLSRKDMSQAVDLIITSPPYMKVVNYGTANWIRLWWLGIDDVSTHTGSGRRQLDARLDHGHGYAMYEEFMQRVLRGIEYSLAPGGVAVVVIGDVAEPGGVSVPLAWNVWKAIEPQSGLGLLDFIEDDVAEQNKVSRIWGETRGQATNRDCILILNRQGESPNISHSAINWEEPYRDAGPDAAHSRVQKRRQSIRRIPPLDGRDDDVGF
ncbi:MAG: DNA methyltransferase [Actinomycetes bacterium]